MDSQTLAKEKSTSITQTIPQPNPSNPAHSVTHSLCPQMSFPGENLGFIPNAGGTLGQTDRMRKVVRTLPMVSIAFDVTYSSPPSLGGLSGFSNEQERSWKRVQSAGTSYHRDTLYCARPAGNY